MAWHRRAPAWGLGVAAVVAWWGTVAAVAWAATCDTHHQVEAEYYVYPVAPNPSCVVTGDWNEDGRQDVVTSNLDDSSLTVLLGAGGFELRPGGTVKLGQAPRWVVPRDLNGDGHLDLVVSDDQRTSVLVGDGHGGFREGARYPVGGRYVAVGDVNGDGDPDILVGAPLRILFLHGLEVVSQETLSIATSLIALGLVTA